MRLWYRLTPLQRAGITILNLGILTMTILFLVYSQHFFHWLNGVAEKWREIPGGWLILWVMAFFVAFPPMIGYSSCITISGFVFGMKGFLIVSTATVAGSTCAFIVSRGLLKEFVGRLTSKDKRFAALALVLKHDGLKLLIMIRLCPLPYSLSNGAISTIPTVTWQNFAIATAAATPKLLLGVFVGSRLGDLAENGDKMDTKTRIISWVSIIIGISAGIGTGYWVYVRTKARARQLESEEAVAATAGRRTSDAGRNYIDDLESQDGAEYMRRTRSDISLHQTYEDVEAGGGGGYRDEFTDDEDNHERDAFDEGDGGFESEDGDTRKKNER